MSMADASHLSDEELDRMIAEKGVSMDPVNHVIDAREASHGPYREQAMFAQLLKGMLRRHKNWEKLPGEQRESLEMVMLKVSRIMSGTGNEPDHWIDMSGYSMLIFNLMTTGDHRAP